MANQPNIRNQYGMGQGPIRFYNRDDPYYEFTNFYLAPIDLDGKTWPTTEHYFQAQKFIGTSFPEVIRNFERPRQAFDLSRNPTVSRWRRNDWEDIKIDIMRKALLAKFTQHKHLRQLLLRTGDNMLIEHTPYDKFWGDGGDGTGDNHLGLLLMEIRHDLKQLHASLYKQEETPVKPRVTPDTHRERIQRSESTEKDGQGSHSSSSSSSSCLMEYTSTENQNQQNGQEPANQDPQNDSLTRPPLHPMATENAPHQHAATGGEGSSQSTTTPPSPSAVNDPPVADLINFDDTESSEEDKNNPMMMDGAPPNLVQPLQPMQSTTQAGQCMDQAADTSTNAGKAPSSSNGDDQPEQMDTGEPNNIH